MRAARIRRKKKPQPPEQEAEVVAGGGEDGIDGIALAVPEIVPAHAVLGLHVTDDRLDDRRRISRLILGVTRRLWPAMKTLNL